MKPLGWIAVFTIVWLFFGLVGVAAVLVGLWLQRRYVHTIPNPPNPARRNR